MDLNERQRAAVETIDGRLVVTAGPGSGKTRVVVERILHLFRHGVHPNDVVATTFTTRAADELSERLERASGKRPRYVGTIHGFARYLLRRFPDSHPLGADFSILDTADVSDLYAAARAENRLRLPLGKLRAKIDEVLAGGDPYAVPAEDSPVGIEARALLLAYRKAKDRLRAEDFDGLIHRARVLLAEKADVAATVVLEVQHLMVDEAQDLDPAQDAFLELASRPDLAVPGVGRSTCYVGDVLQSIYGWRAGDPTLFLARMAKATTVVHLDANYRSAPEIVALSNRIAAADPLRPDGYTLRAVRS